MFLTTAILSSLALSTPHPAANLDEACSASKKAATVAHQTASKGIVETALSNEAFSTLVTALKAADLVDALQGDGPFTVFAPTNDAFAKLPKERLAQLLEPKNKALLQSILTYHVVPGSLDAAHVTARDGAATLNGQRIEFQTTDDGVRVDGAAVTKADIRCSNGVIHVIDSVVLPSTENLVETAVEAGSFETLAAALSAAGLAEALQGDGPFTVFAPTDEAFAKLPAGKVQSLLEPANRDELSSILLYHVVAGRQYAGDVVKAGALTTLQGDELEVHVRDGEVRIGGARIVSTDLDATNGVIHVIDTVLLPH